ncbi:UDP-N-acetylmuramoyl-tripeptide--D-alanyl-D-alanine ligase [Arsenicitalea aurantiaca]|nr:UDP-N-acetylmuramoyl-tripeptide--D-alanyl-D-alanine ligase [Arsenicitalea aurantiaca]
MKALWSVEEILSATGGEARGLDPATRIGSVSIDSRDIAPGALFVAIQGDRFDGHDFVAKALDAGAAAALVCRNRADALGEDGLIVVSDPLDGLRDLGEAARERSRAQIVAVTGSVGKTTTKEAIRTVLSAAGETHASIKSFNNHWGVPLTLARLPRSAQFGVFEIGMNHAGEIGPLSEMVRPHVAVITAIAPAHLEMLGSIEAIARAKAEIYSGLEPGGTAVINADHGQLDILLKEAEAAEVGSVITYGFSERAEWRILSCEILAGTTRASIAHAGDEFTLTLNVPGRHMAANALAALIVAHLSGVERPVALEALAGFSAGEGRGAARLLGSGEKKLLLIDESYNANTASMQAAMDVFAAQAAPGGRKVLVLGDMLELGAEGPAMHAALAGHVRATGAEAVFLVGPAMSALAEALGEAHVTLHVSGVDEVVEPVLNALAYGDAVMIKGSNGVRLAGLVHEIRGRFS